MKKRTDQDPNEVTGEPRGRAEQKLVRAEETIARKVFGRCSLFCGDADCRNGCSR